MSQYNDEWEKIKKIEEPVCFLKSTALAIWGEYDLKKVAFVPKKCHNKDGDQERKLMTPAKKKALKCKIFLI